MTTPLLERKFHDEMIRLYRVTGEATGYWANRYLQKVRRVGGLQAAHDALTPTADMAAGLVRLAKEHRLDLSLEYLVLQPPWRDLFTPDELRVARERLAAVRAAHQSR